MRLGDYYEGFSRGYYAYLAPGTAQGYDGDWRNHIAGEFGEWEMEDIRVRHINAWLASDHFAGRPGAARSAYKTLRQILRSAMGDELYSDEVVDPTTRGIRLPPMDGRLHGLLPARPGGVPRGLDADHVAEDVQVVLRLQARRRGRGTGVGRHALYGLV